MSSPFHRRTSIRPTAIGVAAGKSSSAQKKFAYNMRLDLEDTLRARETLTGIRVAESYSWSHAADDVLEGGSGEALRGVLLPAQVKTPDGLGVGEPPARYLENHGRQIWVETEEACMVTDRKSPGRKGKRFAENRVACSDEIIALPAELTPDEQHELLQEYLREEYTSKGLAVSYSIHKPDVDNANFHAHVMVTHRVITTEGMGEPYRDPEVRFQKFKNGSVKAHVREQEHERWRRFQNQFFERRGLPYWCPPPSLAPGVHIGNARMPDSDKAAANLQAMWEAQELAVQPDRLIKALTLGDATFSVRELETYLTKHSLPYATVMDAAEAVVAHPDVVKLYDPATGEHTGLYTARNVYEADREILRTAVDLNARTTHAVSADLIEASIAAADAASIEKHGSGLKDEQKAAIRLMAGGTDLVVVEGRPGAGKSTAMKTAREILKAAGYETVGMAPSNKVALAMREDGFETASTIHSALLKKNDEDSLEPWKVKNSTWTAKTVVFIDEAGMADSLAYSQIMAEAKRTGAKIVLIGDTRQLDAVGRGGIHADIVGKLPHAKLEEIVRQRGTSDQERDLMRAAGKHFSRGEIKEGLKIYDDLGAITYARDQAVAREALAHKWMQWHLHNPETALSNHFIVAARNADVRAISEEIQGYRQKHGELGEALTYKTVRNLAAGPQEFDVQLHVGDRWQSHQTDKHLGLLNGSYGTVTAVAEGKISVKLDGSEGKVISFDPAEIKDWSLGYAGTVHRAQGATIRKVSILHDASMAQSKLTLVQWTRHVEEVELFAGREMTENLDKMAAQMGRTRDKVSTNSFRSWDDLSLQMQQEEIKRQGERKALDEIESIQDRAGNRAAKEEAERSKIVSLEAERAERERMRERAEEAAREKVAEAAAAAQRGAARIEAEHGRQAASQPAAPAAPPANEAEIAEFVSRDYEAKRRAEYEKEIAELRKRREAAASAGNAERAFDLDIQIALKEEERDLPPPPDADQEWREQQARHAAASAERRGEDTRLAPANDPLQRALAEAVSQRPKEQPEGRDMDALNREERTELLRRFGLDPENLPPTSDPAWKAAEDRITQERLVANLTAEEFGRIYSEDKAAKPEDRPTPAAAPEPEARVSEAPVQRIVLESDDPLARAMAKASQNQHARAREVREVLAERFPHAAGNYRRPVDERTAREKVVANFPESMSPQVRAEERRKADAARMNWIPKSGKGSREPRPIDFELLATRDRIAAAEREIHALDSRRYDLPVVRQMKREDGEEFLLSEQNAKISAAQAMASWAKTKAEKKGAQEALKEADAEKSRELGALRNGPRRGEVDDLLAKNRIEREGVQAAQRQIEEQMNRTIAEQKGLAARETRLTGQIRAGYHEADRPLRPNQMDEVKMPWLRGRGSIPEDHEYLKLRDVVIDQESEVSLLRRQFERPWTKALTKEDAERSILKEETLNVTRAHCENDIARRYGPKKRRKDAEVGLERAKAELRKAYDKLQTGKGKEKVDALMASTATQARADEITRGAILAKLDTLESELRVNSYRANKLAKIIGADQVERYVPPERWRERYLDHIGGHGAREIGEGERQEEGRRRRRNRGEMVR